MARRPALSESELEVLKVLWDGGPSTVREVAGVLESRGKRWAYTTVQTYLNRLRAKGHVACESGADASPAHVFRADSTRDDLLRDGLQDLADQLCEGAPSPLVLTLVEGNRFSAEEIARFRTLLNRHQGKR